MKKRRGTRGLLLLLLLLFGCVHLASSQDQATTEPDSNSMQKKIGEACDPSKGCGYEYSVCDEKKLVCQCKPDYPVVSVDQQLCGKSAQLGDPCQFNAQCASSLERSECIDGTCQCNPTTKTLKLRNDTTICLVRGQRRYGERCEDIEECGYEHSYCLESNHTCICHPDNPVTDFKDKCGKGVQYGGNCTFDAQCQHVTNNTVCRDGRCTCKFQMKAETQPDKSTLCIGGTKKMLDKCSDVYECGFDYGMCDGRCKCLEDYPASNQIDMCGKYVAMFEECQFNEQCEHTEKSSCNGGRCGCMFELVPEKSADGSWVCTAKKSEEKSLTHIDPAMIGVLVGMALMFIILCVVLRLFSKARWRENRTIFNTPNPRLMNVSLLRDSKLLHGSGDQRRGSRASVRAPSRQPSMASLRPQSPSASLGSRRGSKASNTSATSTKSPRSPSKNMINSSDAPIIESVTVEIQDPKA